MQPRWGPVLPRPPRLSFPKRRLLPISSHSRGPRALGQGVRGTVPCQRTATKGAPLKTRQAMSVPQVPLGAKASESKSTRPPAGPADV